MEKATKIQDLLKLFPLKLLSGNDFHKFRVETSKARERDSVGILTDYFSTNRETPKKVLFMGHRGSGKSTELNQLAENLKDSFCVISFSVRSELNLRGMEYLDLVCVILEKLLNTAVNEGVKIDKGVLDNIYSYWHDEKFKEIYTIDKVSEEASIEAKVGFLKVIMSNIEGVLAKGQDTKETIRKHIEPKVSMLIDSINELGDIIRTGLAQKGKIPIVIVKDLDKLSIPDAKDLFLNHSHVLMDIKVHVIYTVPIFLNYAIEFDEIRRTFDYTELLNMIKVNDINGMPYGLGRDVIKEIVSKRASLELFEPVALEFMIEKSGGVLTHLFEMIQSSALTARSKDRNITQVDYESAKEACKELRNNFERTIWGQHIGVLRDIYNSSKRMIQNEEAMIEMLAYLAVIEYNGGVCLLHPAVKDMMERCGIIEKV